MKKNEIKVGGSYLAKVAGAITTVRVDAIREQGVSTRWDDTQTSRTVYDVTNLRTGRKTTFRSAAKFRAPARAEVKVVLDADHPGGKTTAEVRTVYRQHTGLSVGPLGGLVMAASCAVTTPAGDSRNVPSDAQMVDLARDIASADAGARAQHAVETSEPVCCNCGEARLLHYAGNDKVDGWCDLCDPGEGEHCSDPTVAPSAVERPTTTSGSEIATKVGSHTSVTPVATSFPPATSGPTTEMPSGQSTTGRTGPSGAGGSLPTSLAGKIAATRTTREVGSPVAGMVPTAEQEAIIATALELYYRTDGPRVMIGVAGAGTGKTATDLMLEQVLPGRGQVTAFNSAIIAEGKRKFKNAAVNTTHSLAFRAVGRAYQHRLGGDRMRSNQVAHILGITPMRVQVPGQVDADGAPRLKTLTAEFLAGQVLVAVRKFCQSADREIGEEHLRYIDGIDGPVERLDGTTVRGRENNDRVRDYLVPFAKKAWADIVRLDGQLPFSHDCYVKIWQLGRGDDRPIIAADYILLDEAQDTAPVFLDVLKQQTHALLVLVGDDNQQIYEWRGAVNAMGAFSGAPRCLLSQSYRFGQALADVANAVLATLEEPTDLVMRGMPTIPTRVAEVASPRCYLYSTNAGAVGRVMVEFDAGKRPHLIGGGADVVAWCQAALDLQGKRGTRHPELCCFDTWGEVVEYSKTDEGGDLKLMVKMVDTFGAAKIIAALKDMPKEEDADLVVSTAHKSKGREWETVKLGPDFPLVNKMSDPDRRLLYVAATRAKLTLDISECPPFCGGEERSCGEDGPEARWVPGLEVTYTCPMPTEGDQAEWVCGKLNVKIPVAEQQFNAQTAGKFTWCKFGSGWCARGSKDAVLGTEVQVERRDGSVSTVTLRRVVQRYDDAWIYGV